MRREMGKETVFDYYGRGVAHANDGQYKLAIDAFRKAEDLLPPEPKRKGHPQATAIGYATSVSIEMLKESMDADHDSSVADTSELGLILEGGGGRAGPEMWDDLVREKQQDALYSIAVLFRGIVCVARIRISEKSLNTAINTEVQKRASHPVGDTAAFRPCLALDWSAAFMPLWRTDPLGVKQPPLPRWIPHHMRDQKKSSFTYRFGVAMLPESEYRKVRLSASVFVSDPRLCSWHEGNEHVRIESFGEIARLVEVERPELIIREGPGAHPDPTYNITSLVEVGCAPWSISDRYRLKLAHFRVLEPRFTIRRVPWYERIIRHRER
jgi:hypothetical protein